MEKPKEGAIDTSDKLKWENQPFSPDNSLRARKDTITMSTRRIRSFLEDQNPERLEEANWLSVMNGGSSSDPITHNPIPQDKSLDRATQYRTELQNGKIRLELPVGLPELIGFLVSYDNGPSGETFPLRAGRWIVSSVPLNLPETTLLIEDKTIAPVHATLSVSESGGVRVQDHFSRTGTAVKSKEAQSESVVEESYATLNHGDTVRFGERKFRVCIIPK